MNKQDRQTIEKLYNIMTVVGDAKVRPQHAYTALQALSEDMGAGKKIKLDQVGKLNEAQIETIKNVLIMVAYGDYEFISDMIILNEAFNAPEAK